ncbi:MAG: hypothetical protein AAF639_04205 [Chloroflexota bacterium]
MATQQKNKQRLFCKITTIIGLFVLTLFWAQTSSVQAMTPAMTSPAILTQEVLGPILVLKSNPPMLEVDSDGNGAMSPGDTIRYTATINNTGDRIATGARYLGTLDANLSLVLGSVVLSQGTVEPGGTSYVQGELGDVEPGSPVSIEFLATINIGEEITEVLTSMSTSYDCGDDCPIGGQPGGLDEGVTHIPVASEIAPRTYRAFLPMITR